MTKILVVDDEAYMREMMQDILEEAGYTVETATDGAQAISSLARRRPDLLITDILMPNQGGLNLIREATRRHEGLPVIAVSGGGKDGKLNFLRTAGTYPGVRTLDKPFGAAQLLELVGASLA
jgi:CheY-like chemotaxis protein